MKYRIVVLMLAAFGVSCTGCRFRNVGDPEAGDVQVSVETVVEEEPLVPDEQPLLLEDEPLLLEDEPLLLEDEPLLLEDEPLLLEDEPLLLDDPAFDDGGWDIADNSRCHVCHMNYQQEAIAVTHAKHGIACKDCHGVSDAHIADESWASGGPGTAPDRMFPRDTINSFCMGCHPKDGLDRPEHAPVFRTDEDRKVCTDCHGEHRLHTRKCRWK